jgi:hypothetical protein
MAETPAGLRERMLGSVPWRVAPLEHRVRRITGGCPCLS